MKTIWKYELAIVDEQKIEMPSDAELLTIQVQKGVPCMWVLVDPKAIKATLSFRIFGAGHPIDNADSLKYLGTFQVAFGDLVFHVFR